MAMIDLKGQRFGALLVLERAGSGAGRQARWRCVCDCGREIEVVSQVLRKGKVSCGCLTPKRNLGEQHPVLGEKAGKSKMIDLKGQRFGALLVLERAGSGAGRQARWRCICDCGREIEVLSQPLRKGQMSCGCLTSEKTRVAREKYKEKDRALCREVGKKNLIDMKGQRFGALLVLERAGNTRTSREARWKCRCDCGREIEVAGRALRSGQQSCGCRRRRIEGRQ